MRFATGPHWLVLLALLTCACSDDRRPAAPAHDAATGKVRLEVGSVPVEVELARTSSQRARGLAGVSSLAPEEGMLFVYPDTQRRQFWMRDCLIALDVAFLDASGRVLQVDTLQPPRPEAASIPRTRRSAPSAYVLELRAGFFERHGLGVGTRVKIPARVRSAEAE